MTATPNYPQLEPVPPIDAWNAAAAEQSTPVSHSTGLNDHITGPIRDLVRRKAKNLCRRPGLKDLDHQDIEQDFWTHLAAKWHQFDPARGTAHAFAITLIRRKTICILRHRFAQCRDSRHKRSLNRSAGVIGGRLTEFADLIPANAHESRLRARGLSDEDYLDLALDMAELAKDLLSCQRQLCTLLMRLTIAEAARNLDISRGSAHTEVKSLRVIFEAKGLRRYLPKNSDSSSRGGVVTPIEELKT